MKLILSSWHIYCCLGSCYLHPEAIKEEMETDPEESDSRVAKKRMLDQIVIIPATLYFPTSIVAELNEICESLGYTPEQLVIEALKGQIDHWNEFYEQVMTLPIDPEDLLGRKILCSV